MPHQVHLRTLGRTSDHRMSMLRNLAVAVLRYERVRTTEAKAKEVRRLVDRAVVLGKERSLTARRRAIALLRDGLIVEKVFDDLAGRYAQRPSGFTRLVRLGHRVGDGAPLMLVELVEGQEPSAPPEKVEKEEKEAPAPKRVARARALAQKVTGRSGAKKAAGAKKATREKEKSAKS